MMCVTSDRIDVEEAIRENESFPKCTPTGQIYYYIYARAPSDTSRPRPTPVEVPPPVKGHLKNIA